jgi:phage baseplate assembly protein W
MNIDFPFHFDALGNTASTDDADHIRDMIEQLLLTRPGERVNRPTFGSGLLHALFTPNSPQLAAALEQVTKSAVQDQLLDVIDVQTLTFTAEDSTLRMELKYSLKRTGEPRNETFELTPR